MNCPYCIKICTKCNKLLVACNINFYKHKKGKYGLDNKCKECVKKYYQDNREKILKRQNNYNEEHKEEKAEYMKQYYQDNREEILKQQAQYYQDNREEIAERNKQYNEEHKEEIAEHNKQYYQDNREEILKQQAQYYQDNREEILKYQKQYHKNNPHIVFNSNNKRRQKLGSQGNGVTNEQLYEMYKFFNGECAYSGIQLKKGVNKSIDHIVALDNGGLNEIWNCVPMVKSYNSSKRTKDMLDWYTKQPFYSEERLEKIYTWCEYAWNKWGYRKRKGNKKIIGIF